VGQFEKRLLVDLKARFVKAFWDNVEGVFSISEPANFLFSTQLETRGICRKWPSAPCPPVRCPS
jgi:hypothetical protein